MLASAPTAWIRGISSKTLFVVGDDGQAIYAWRGADVGNIIPFDQRYPNSSSHTLPHNFRSTPTIVESADTFAHQELGPARIPKDPTADAPGTPQDFRNLWFDTRAEEAEWVAALTEELMGTLYTERNSGQRGLSPGDFAILIRSVRAGQQKHRAPSSLHRRVE